MRTALIALAMLAFPFLFAERSTWTLVLRGPYRRTWGFLTPEGWVPWQQFVAEKLKDVPTPREARPYEAASSL